MRNQAQVTSRLVSLENLPKDALRVEWHRLFGKPAPEGLRKDLMLRIVAYRIQELAFGGLKPETRKRLKEVAKALNADRHAQVFSTTKIKPGTRLLREWNGKIHIVTVIEGGFGYEGRRFGSLSAIARVITGTRWSGPLFFGLKHKGRDD